MLFLQLLGSASLLIFSAYLTGAVVVYALKINAEQEEVFFSLFIKLVIGISLIAFGYAALKTGAETILLPVPVLLYLTFKYAGLQLGLPSADRPARALRQVRSELLLMLVLGLPIFLFRWLLHYHANSPYLAIPFQDYVFYARLADIHNTTGIESGSLEKLYPNLVYEQPYHYLELWLNALLVYLTKLPSIWTLCISIYACFMLVAAVGLGAVIRFFGVNYAWTLLAALLTLAITGVEMPFFTQWSVTANGYLMAGLSFILYPKTAPIYIFLALGTLFLLRKHYMAAFCAIAVLPLVYVTTLPSITIGAALLSSVLYISGKTSFKASVLLLIPLISSSLYLLGFYALHPSPTIMPASIKVEAFKTFLPLGLSTVTLFNIFAGTIINYVAFYFMYFLLLLIVVRWPALVRNHQVTLLWLLFVLVSASCFRAVTTRNIDSWQFVSTITIPLSSVSFAVLFGFGLSRFQLAGKIGLLGALLLITLFNNRSLGSQPAAAGTQRFSPEFLAEVSANLPPSAIGGYLMALSDYTTPYMMNPDAHIYGTYLYGLGNGYSSISLSVLDAARLRNERFSKDTAQIDYVVAKSTLNQFRKKLQAKGLSYSSDSLKYKFIRQYHLAFICASPAAQLPATLQPLVSKTLTDALSGEKLYILTISKP